MWKVNKMCIIAIKPKGKKMIDRHTIETMFGNNPDGAGYMYYDVDAKKVRIVKGFMTCNSLLKSLNKKDLTNTNVVIHFRIGTSGLNDKNNCHPYPIYDNNNINCLTDIALAHNGILKGYEPHKDSKINDTQVFIRDVLKPLKTGWQNDKDKTGLINKLIGTNKFAILDKNNKVTLIGDFISENGYIYSNTSFRAPKVYYPTYYSNYKPKNEKDDLFSSEYDEKDFWSWFDEKYVY